MWLWMNAVGVIGNCHFFSSAGPENLFSISFRFRKVGFGVDYCRFLKTCFRVGTESWIGDVRYQLL